MKIKLPYGNNSVGGALTTVGLTIVISLLLALVYFYIYLPNSTNHGEEVVVPFLITKHIDQVDSILATSKLRYEVGDSSYSSDYPPLTVLQQYPRAGHMVKENRKIYISINRMSPPTLPVPNLVESGGGSLANAEAVLRSNELKRGRIIYQNSPFRDLILEMRMNGKVLTPGTRINKGSVIDLVVGNGGGPKDFVIQNLVGYDYLNVLLRLRNLSLHLGTVQIPEGVDTTGIVAVVLKQFPAAGDSVSVGDPVDLWIGPRGFELKEEENENDSGK